MVQLIRASNKKYDTTPKDTIVHKTILVQFHMTQYNLIKTVESNLTYHICLNWF